ncbi:MAG: carbon-nitrogen family hydrolase [Actinomycetes bacterium]
MSVALLQLDVSDDESPADRVQRAQDLVRAEAGRDLVVLPELWPTGAFAYEDWVASAEPIDGPFVASMAAVARESGVRLHLGSFIERDGDDLFNTSVLLGADGEVEASYRKIHLFGFSEGEPRLLTAGTEVVVADGLGLSTCYDLRFPELYRRLVDAGAEVLVIVAGWPARRAGHWRVLAQARAIESQCFVVACATAGTHAGVPMSGGSLVIDPWGTILAEGPNDAAVLHADLDLAAVARTRAQFPVLPDRRLG